MLSPHTSMRYELLKLLVQPVVVERDESGGVVGERLPEPRACYSLAQVKEFLDVAEREIAAANGQPKNGGGGTMPVESAQVVHIVCDNPACPGNTLDPADRVGWLFVSSEVYGEPTQQNVFCSAECVSAATGDPAAAAKLGFTKAAPVEAPAEPATT